MTHLCTLIQFVQDLCLEDETVNNMLQEIDEMSRENTKLENQLEECDRENVRLQIQFHNLKMITSFIDISAIDNLKHTSKHMYSECIELKNLIEAIDFTKILKCYHMEIEAKCRKEWQPIQDCFAKTLAWHEKMEERHIVQKYRQTEIAYRAAEEAKGNQQKSMEVSLKQSLELINQAKDRRNNLVLNLIKGSKELNAFETKMLKLNQYGIYIEGLRQEKEKLASQLEQKHLKAFNPILSLNNNQNFTGASEPSSKISNFIMPKLPSFADVLRSFNQTEKLTSVTSIENSTNICVKSILTTSKKSITTKQTKSVHFKMELETESENDIQMKGHETCLETDQQLEKKDSLQEMKDLENVSNTDFVDLLSPAESSIETVKETQKVMSSLDGTSNSKNENDNKPLVQDCIIFKSPFPVQEVLNMQYKETITNSVTDNCSQKSNETHSCSSSHSDITKILNTTKRSFYEEFLKVSSSDEASPQRFETSSILNANTTNLSEVQEFLDFDSNKAFGFDSDDNMTDNYSTRGNMDFM